MNKDILVIGEHEGGRIKKSVLGILTKAKEIGDNVLVVLLGKDLADNKEILGKFGISKVYLYNDANLEHYNPETYGKLLVDLINEVKPGYVFSLASSLGKDLMPRIAAKMEAGLASDCINVKPDGDNLIFTRPVYAGKAFADLRIKSEPAMATFRPNVLEVKEQEKTSEVEVINKETNVDVTNLSHKLIEVIKGQSDKPDLTEAEIIVSGGRGVKTSEDFNKLLKELAEAIDSNAVVGASRAVVDAGLVPHSMQVGQTGKTVTPILYIACGISGAMQHRAGMTGSKCIVAINKDPEAPIFEIADYGIVGDVYEIIPKLREAIKKLKAE